MENSWLAPRCQVCFLAKQISPQASPVQIQHSSQYASSAPRLSFPNNQDGRRFCASAVPELSMLTSASCSRMSQQLSTAASLCLVPSLAMEPTLPSVFTWQLAFHTLACRACWEDRNPCMGGMLIIPTALRHSQPNTELFANNSWFKCLGNCHQLKLLMISYVFSAWQIWQWLLVFFYIISTVRKNTILA